MNSRTLKKNLPKGSTVRTRGGEVLVTLPDTERRQGHAHMNQFTVDRQSWAGNESGAAAMIRSRTVTTTILPPQ